MDDNQRRLVEELAENGRYLMSAVSRRCYAEKKAYWDEEDAVQEAYLKIMMKIEKYYGQSSFKTWAYTVAINSTRDLSRRALMTSSAVVRSSVFDSFVGEDASEDFFDGIHDRSSLSPSKRMEFSEAVKDLLSWLKEDSEIAYGWEVMNLLLKNGGDRFEVASLMSAYTQTRWTWHKVRSVVSKIYKTEQGKALAEFIAA